MLKVPCCLPSAADRMEERLMSRCGWEGGGWVQIPDSGETELRTEFQINMIRDIAQRPTFVHFCGNPIQMEGKPDYKYRGPFCVTWYEENPAGGDNQLHIMRVGQNKVLVSDKIPALIPKIYNDHDLNLATAKYHK